jgi:hypothetical protein
MKTSEQILLEFYNNVHTIWYNSSELPDEIRKQLEKALDEVTKQISDWQEPTNLGEMDYVEGV